MPRRSVGAPGAALQQLGHQPGQFAVPENPRVAEVEAGVAQPAVVGPNNASDAGDEATLDVEYQMGLAPNVTTTFFSTGGRQFEFAMLSASVVERSFSHRALADRRGGERSASRT